MSGGREKHWEHIYTSKADQALSWTQRSPVVSLDLIRRFARPGASVVDIGGGSSGLAGMLVQEGFSPCAVVDISHAALDRARSRLDPSIRTMISWYVADILSMPALPSFDVWHDRALFHFLVDAGQRATYAALAERTVAPQALMVLAAFSLDGPEKCSGLPVQRYDAATLAQQFERGFHLKWEGKEVHETPWGTTQHFLYVVLERRPERAP